MRETWYLLFDGTSTSPDGSGPSRFCGRTTDKEEARRHYLKCRDNWFSTGGVAIVTDTEVTIACGFTKWDSIP